jgi:WD40 repeat protein
VTESMTSTTSPAPGQTREVAYDAFISYSRQDWSSVELLAVRLANEGGLRMWLDKARLQPGIAWRDEIETNLNRCAAALIVWGPGGLGPVQRQERGLAYAIRDAEPDFRLIHVFLPGTDRPRASWANIETWVRFESGLDEPDTFAQLVAGLKGVAPLGQLVADLPDEPAPFRGLAAFGVEDATIFFGRGAYLEEMVERLSHHPFLAVMGPSGSGKTSLVQAGLLARLKARQVPGRPVGHQLVVRPGPHPLNALALVLTRLQPNSSPLVAADEFLLRMQKNPASISEIIQSLLAPEERLTLVVDRLEEIFTLCESEAERTVFLDALLALARHPHQPAWLVVAMRADFYDRVGRHADLVTEIVSHQVYLRPMEIDNVAEIIEAPAAQVGAVFEKGLAQQVRTDAEVQGELVLPLLEHTLDLLWRKRTGRWMTWDAYREIHGVSGALRYHADRVIEALQPEEQVVAQRLLLRLVWLDETTGTIAGRRVRKDELFESSSPDPQRVEFVLQRLADERLIVLRGETTFATAELIHDSLPLRWERLRQWMHADQEFLLWRQRLRAALDNWVHAHRDAGALLRGNPVSEAESWLEQRADEFNPDEREYVRESVALKKRDLAGRERVRRRVVLGLTAGLIAALALATFALAQRQVALDQEQKAQNEGQVAEQQRQEADTQRRLAVDQTQQAVDAKATAVAAQHIAEEQRQVALDRLARVLAVSADLVVLQKDQIQLGTLLAAEAIDRVPSETADRILRSNLPLLRRTVATLGNENGANAVAFSPSGKYLVSLVKHGAARLWEQGAADTWMEVPDILPTRGVAVVAFSPDGRYLGVARDDGNADIRDVANNWTVVKTLPHGRAVTALGFSKDGQYLVTAEPPNPSDKSNVLRVWDGANDWTQAGETAVGEPGTTVINSVAFSPGDRFLAAVYRDRVLVWDFPLLQSVADKSASAGELMSVKFSPDGTYLAAVGNRQLGDVQIWNVSRYLTPVGGIASTDAWSLVSMPNDPVITHQSVAEIAFDPHAPYLATAGQDGTMRVWDLSGSQSAKTEIARLPHDGGVSAVAFSPDGKYLATASTSEPPRIWQFAIDREPPYVLNATALAFSPDERYAVTADKTVARVRDVTNGWAVAAELPNARTISHVVFSSRGHYLATVAQGQQARNSFANPVVYLFDATRDWKLVATFDHPGSSTGHPGPEIEFSPDERYLATTWSGVERVFTVDASGVWAQLPDTVPSDSAGPGFSSTWRFRVHTDGKTLSVLAPATALAQAASVWTQPWNSRDKFTFSPDDRYLASWGEDNFVHIRETDGTWADVAQLGHDGRVLAATFSSDGMYLATASMDGSARVWSPAGGWTRLAQLPHGSAVSSVVFSPKGGYLATSGVDGVVHVWDTLNGWREVGASVQSSPPAAFSPDARFLVYGRTGPSPQVSAQLWRPHDLVDQVCARLARNLTPASEWAKYLGDEPYRKVCPDLR